MNDDRVIAIIWIVGALTLAGSAIARRRLGGSETFKLGLLWAGIILLGWGGVIVIQRLLH